MTYRHSEVVHTAQTVILSKIMSGLWHRGCLLWHRRTGGGSRGGDSCSRGGSSCVRHGASGLGVLEGPADNGSDGGSWCCRVTFGVVLGVGSGGVVEVLIRLLLCSGSL